MEPSANDVGVPVAVPLVPAKLYAPAPKNWTISVIVAEEVTELPKDTPPVVEFRVVAPPTSTAPV